MEPFRDFSDLVRELSSEKVRFLLVGGYAVALHAEPRYTKDLDIWADPAADNVQRLWVALARFGAPLAGMAVSDFTNERLVLQMGIEPNRIDILMGIDGVTFARAWKNRVGAKFGDLDIFVISRADLIRNKKASGRPQDLRDIELLQKPRRKNPRRR